MLKLGVLMTARTAWRSASVRSGEDMGIERVVSGGLVISLILPLNCKTIHWGMGNIPQSPSLGGLSSLTSLGLRAQISPLNPPAPFSPPKAGREGGVNAEKWVCDRQSAGRTPTFPLIPLRA